MSVERSEGESQPQEDLKLTQISIARARGNRNSPKESVPLWGTCLGFEWLNLAAGATSLDSGFDAEVGISALLLYSISRKLTETSLERSSPRA